jgi:hypothetical protein
VIAITATSPDGAYTLDTGGVTLTQGAAETPASASLELTSEALLRLVYGRGRRVRRGFRRAARGQRNAGGAAGGVPGLLTSA